MQQIGRYEVERELGRGAMGVVYLARDTRIGRSVALKTIRLSDFADAEKLQRLRERLVREAQSAGILSHDNIVTIYDVDEQEGLSYISMEYVEGDSLERMLERRRELSRETFLSIMRQMGSALDFAHSRGIVHRDIKPPNVMVTPLGRVKITDFGVAKVTHASSMTQGGAMLGTPDYMSPEQIAGSGVDGRADQFSLAVIAFELLAGEKPFVAETLPSLFYRIAHEPSPDVTLLNPSLGSEIGRVLEKAMAKNIGDRYETCSSFVEALAAACDRSPGWHPLPRGMSQTLPTLGDAGRAGRKTTEDSKTPVAETMGPTSDLPKEPWNDQPTGPVAVPLPPPPVSINPVSVNPGPVNPLTGQPLYPATPPPVPPMAEPVPAAPAYAGGGFITPTAEEPPQPDWLHDAELEEIERKRRRRNGILGGVIGTLAVAAILVGGYILLGGDPLALLPGQPEPPPEVASAEPDTTGQTPDTGSPESANPDAGAPGQGAESSATDSGSAQPESASAATDNQPADTAPAQPVNAAPVQSETPPAQPPKPSPSKPRGPERPTQKLAIARFMSEPPGATVTVDADSRMSCDTPCTLDLSVGRHTYSVRMAGYRNEIKLIELGEFGQTVSVKLQRKVGMVRVQSNPAGATIYVNGEKQSALTPSTLRLIPGDYRITIERDGQRVERNVSVKEDAALQIEATLQ